MKQAAAMCLAGVLSTGCVVSVDSHSEIVREEKRFTVSGTPEVRVATFDGSIQVQSWDRSEVLIEIEKRGPTKEAIQGVEIVATQNGNTIDLEVKRPRSESFSGIGLHRTADARLVVSLPKNANLRARSGDGAVRVDGVTGRLELRTGDGSVRASDVSGDITVDTGDGSVTVSNAEGKLSVETGDGSVSVEGSLSAVKLHTGDGSISYRADPGSSMTDNWEITTGDGAVSLYLPSEFSAEVDAHTGDGRISNDLTIARTDPPAGREDARRRTLQGRLGEGGKLLRVRTGDGSIRLKLN